MRHSRTWISRHREDQKDITCLCIFMAVLISFHYAMRVLLIFAICTLKEPPTRLTLQNHNFPHEVVNGFILISCLILVCSILHLAGAMRRRLATKLIAISLVVSSCCLIANSTILRSILKPAYPESIPKLDPQTIIIDIDRRGWISIHNCSVSLTSVKRVLEAPLKWRSSTPVIICADRRTRCSNVWSVVESCHESGATNISVARQEGFDRYDAPIFSEQSLPSDIQTNLVSSVFVYRHAFVLNDRIVNGRDMARVIGDHVTQRTGHWYSVEVAGDAPYENVLVLLHAFQRYGATNLAWEPLR